MTAEQQRGYNKMIGNTTQLTFLTDPSFAGVDGPCSSNAPRQTCAPRNALTRNNPLHSTSILVLPQPRSCSSTYCSSVP